MSAVEGRAHVEIGIAPSAVDGVVPDGPAGEGADEGGDEGDKGPDGDEAAERDACPGGFVVGRVEERVWVM